MLTRGRDRKNTNLTTLTSWRLGHPTKISRFLSPQKRYQFWYWLMATRNPARKKQLWLVVYPFIPLFTTVFLHPRWFSRRMSEPSTSSCSNFQILRSALANEKKLYLSKWTEQSTTSRLLKRIEFCQNTFFGLESQFSMIFCLGKFYQKKIGVPTLKPEFRGGGKKFDPPCDFNSYLGSELKSNLFGKEDS